MSEYPRPSLEEIIPEEAETIAYDPRDDEVLIAQVTSPETFENADGALRSEDLIHSYEAMIAQINPEQAERIIKKIEAMPAYQRYKELAKNFDTLDSLLEDFDAVTSAHPDRDEVAAYRKDLAEKIESVKSACSSYFNKLVEIDRFSNGMARKRMDDREFAEELANKDRVRRIYHDGLLSDLKILWRMSRVNLAKKFGEGVQLPANKLFHPDLLTHENRTAIGSWAVNVTAGSRLDQLKKQAQKALEKRKSA